MKRAGLALLVPAIALVVAFLIILLLGMLADATGCYAAEPQKVVLYYYFPDAEMRVKVVTEVGSTEVEVAEACRKKAGGNLFMFLECGDKHNLPMVKGRIELPKKE